MWITPVDTSAEVCVCNVMRVSMQRTPNCFNVCIITITKHSQLTCYVYLRNRYNHAANIIIEWMHASWGGVFTKTNVTVGVGCTCLRYEALKGDAKSHKRHKIA